MQALLVLAVTQRNCVTSLPGWSAHARRKVTAMHQAADKAPEKLDKEAGGSAENRKANN